MTGSHNAKIGYQGGFLQNFSQPRYNDLRMDYTYATPAVQTFCSASTSATTRNACANAVNNGTAAANGAQIVTDASGVATIQNGCYYSPQVAGSPGAAFAAPPTQTTNGPT